MSAITAFVNKVLSGRCPSAIAPIFFGGRLIALNKKSGGINRPIAIGFTLRRLVSKSASFFGGRLKALNKKSGGIRSIAIGFTLHRLD